ncbi:MAG: hypothetical protein HYU56_05115 [Candidatus Aenigmarchaeota archaeon]|nr:hypothetical protein [Candidatus Aenigmarchaeota archaeon]
MLRTIQRLLGKEKEVVYDKTLGYLTREDIERLKEATKKPESPVRKKFYKTWICGSGHLFFYRILRCPLCESRKIEEQTNATSSELVLEAE